MKRKYYSVRTGKNPDGGIIDFATLKKLFTAVYTQLDQEGYFQQYFGYFCVDAGDVPGQLGSDIESVMLFELRKANIWPILSNLKNYSVDDLFDIIEYLYDHVSKPLDGHYHSFSQCGYHYNSFNHAAGREVFRQRINLLLEEFEGGYELSPNGEILAKAPEGFQTLLSADIPITDTSVTARLNAAINKFRRYHSTLDDRRDAIRDLADVLEYLRPSLKGVLKKQDEADLFNIANSFGIRHHNQQQKTDYDQAIWHSWMFYYYLATIHACLRMLKRNSVKNAR